MENSKENVHFHFRAERVKITLVIITSCPTSASETIVLLNSQLNFCYHIFGQNLYVTAKKHFSELRRT